MNERQPIVSSQPQGWPRPNAPQGLLLCPVNGHRRWTSGLFDCMDDSKNCVMTCLCAPCVLCGMGSRMGECVLMPACVPGAAVAMRVRLRTLGGIQGTICNDHLTLLCCNPCAICQMKREMDAMGLM